MVSAFFSILTLMDAEALAGIAKTARASASISANILLNVEPMSGFVPKGRRAFWKPVANIEQCKMLLGLLCMPRQNILLMNIRK